MLAAREAGEAIEEIARRHGLTAGRVTEIIRFEKLRREVCPPPVYRALCLALIGQGREGRQAASTGFPDGGCV
jgi:hypothetical protein